MHACYDFHENKIFSINCGINFSVFILVMLMYRQFLLVCKKNSNFRCRAYRVAHFASMAQALPGLIDRTLLIQVYV